MKKSPNLRSLFALLAVVAPLELCHAQTIFFSDNFSNGSTTNQISTPGGTATASSTSYDFAATKNALSATFIQPNDLRLALATATSSGFIEYQALFATNPVSLNVVGDYIEIDVVFTNTTDTIFDGTATGSSLDLGLFNSGSTYGTITNYPVPNAALNNGLTTTGNSPYASGYCEPWQGYFGQILSNSAPQILTRPMQNGTGTTSANQDLLGNAAGGGLFTNPGGTSLTKGTNISLAIPSTGPCTLTLRITETAPLTLMVSNALYQGAGTGGTLIYSQTATNITGSTSNIASAFDGLGIGVRSVSVSTAMGVTPVMDISSISIFGQSTIPTNPPTITQQPSPTFVTTNGSCAMSVTAIGENPTFQWYRNNAKLSNGGNISGANSSQLVISPAGTGDQFSGANGYYCVVAQGAVPLLYTNTSTNALTLIASTNLIWTGASTIWDINNTVSWEDTNNNSSVFNYGDPVTFNDVGGPSEVNLSANYLSASSVTVGGTSTYLFDGNGSIAGPGPFYYVGSGRLSLNANNTYTGGTLISNANAYVYLENYASFGTGPVTFGLAGGQMEIVPAGSGSVGIEGNIVVADNFTNLIDSDSTFGAVFLGNLSGTAGKTLTIGPGPSNLSTNQYRLRVYGANTVYNANLYLADPNLLFASYQASGTQTYNGWISGPGGFIQKGITTYLNDTNTFTGGAIPAQGAIGLGTSSTGPAGAPTSGPIGTGPLLLFVDSSSSTAGNGFIFAAVNNIILGNPIEYSSGTNNQTLDIGGTNNITLSGPFTLYGNDHSSMTNYPTRSLEVTNTGLTTLTGVISDGGSNYAFNLTGSGITLFDNTEAYGGATTNSGGLLLVNGQVGPGAVVVQTNALIGGTGTITGPVTVQLGGGVTAGTELTAGSPAIGTLTINNSLTLLGGSTNRVKVNKGSGTHDSIVANSIAYNGTLFATNLSGTITTSDTFQVFSTSSESGSFTNVVGSPGPGLGWTFNPTNGILGVVQSVNTNPTNITFKVSGGNLTLSWPADHTGWRLQSQTNSLGVGITTNWTTVSGSTGVDQEVMPLVPTNASVFFRLVYP
jgi:hypothetical protein